MWPDPQFPEEILQEFRDGETLNETEEILDGKLFLCSYHIIWHWNLAWQNVELKIFPVLNNPLETNI